MEAGNFCRCADFDEGGSDRLQQSDPSKVGQEESALGHLAHVRHAPTINLFHRSML